MSNRAGKRRFGPGGGPSGAGAPAEKPKDFKRTMGKLLSYLKAYRVALIVVLVFAVASTAFSIIGPKILGNVTTDIFTGIVGQLSGGGSGIDFGSVGSALLLLLGLYLLSALFSYIQGFIMSGVSMKVTYRFRRDISEKINRMGLGYFESKTHGEVLSRVTNDVDTVSQTLNQSMSQIVSSATMVVGVLIMMFSISWLLTLVALLIIPLSFVVIMLVVRRSQKYFQQQQAVLGQINGHVEEVYAGNEVVRAFNGEEKELERFEQLNGRLYDTAWRSQFLSGLMMPVMNIIGNIGYVAVCILGGALAVGGSIQVGDIQAFVQYVRSFNQPIAQIANVSNIMQSTAAAAERVFEFLEESEETSDEDAPGCLDTVEGHVEFRHVSFGYTADKIVIKDFSADICKGQRIAIVGPTGAGKTTIVKLLMRFYDVNSGAVLLDGRDIRDLSRQDLRAHFGMVLQDTWLFHGTILDNIRYGRLDATDEEVMAAAKAAYAHSFIRTLPDGYQMILNEESSNLSQGQKQLLTIARALLADPEILIFDEATSSVDTRLEILLKKAMNNLMEGRTSFIIAHRLSTIRDADCILVMNEGDIVEQGSHDELLAKGGFYTALYSSQFEQGAS
ncbi:MAG: ABC transporter ATP-binding protein [Christensenellales bacterium]|jgi:ATP-binding cassette subfamily B multidrug efflux pump